MARPTLEGTRQLGDFATTYNWMLTLDVPSGAIAFADADIAQFYSNTGNGVDRINLRCTSTDLPDKTIEPISINIRGFKSKQPGQATYKDSIDLKFIDTVDGMVEAFFSAWLESSWRTSDGYQMSKLGNQGLCTISRLDRQSYNESVSKIWDYILVGAWCSKVGKPTLNSDNGLYEVTATIQMDYFKNLSQNHPAVVK